MRRLGVSLGPLASGGDGGILILFPALCDIVGEWVVWVRGAKKGLNRKKDSADLKGRRPVA